MAKHNVQFQSDRDYDLFLFATNTGKFYADNTRAGRNNASVGHWQGMLRSRIVPAYYRECGRDEGEFTRHDILSAAAMLQSYYVEHANSVSTILIDQVYL